MSRSAAKESFAALRLIRLRILIHGLQPWLSSTAATAAGIEHAKKKRPAGRFFLGWSAGGIYIYGLTGVFMSVVISAADSARLYKRKSSMLPAYASWLSPVRPIFTAAVEPVPRVRTPMLCCSAPFTYSLVPVESATIAMCVQVFSGG